MAMKFAVLLRTIGSPLPPSRTPIRSVPKEGLSIFNSHQFIAGLT